MQQFSHSGRFTTWSHSSVGLWHAVDANHKNAIESSVKIEIEIFMLLFFWSEPKPTSAKLHYKITQTNVERCSLKAEEFFSSDNFFK